VHGGLPAVRHGQAATIFALVFVEVLLDRTTPDAMAQFNAAVQARPES